MLPAREQGLWARRKAKKVYKKKGIEEIRGVLLQKHLHAKKTPFLKLQWWGHRVSSAGLPIEHVLGEYSLS